MDPAAASDPVEAVLSAHEDGRLLALRTSGTTGDPRWVVRTTASWWASFAAYAELAGIDSSSGVWIPGPLTATMNLFAAVQARAVGAALVPGVGDGADRATHAVLTPAALIAHLDDLPAGAHAIVAGDRLSPDLAARAGVRGVFVSHYYGASELSFVAWGAHADDLVAFPGVDVEAREGVLWSRSAFHAVDVAGSDGWASVGDRGTVTPTADGQRVRVDGRADDAVTTAGATVLSRDVERVLQQAAPGRVAVIGLAHARLGQLVAAVVEDEHQLLGLRRAARAGLVDAAQPRVWFAGPDSWPTTIKGETDRHRLHQAAEAGALRRLSVRGACSSRASSGSDED